MMDIQGAIQILKDIYPSPKQIVTGEYPHVADSLDMAIQALEKQIPKKPQEQYNWCDFTEKERHVNDRWFCECQYPLLESETYCPNCGQAIDWEDE